jgi:leucyl aminopeptidase (aminopeptidase T)
MWKKVVEGNLGVRPNERLLVIADAPIELGVPAEVVVAPSTGGHGREPDPQVWRAAWGAAAIAHLELDGSFERILEKRLEPGEEERLREWARAASRLAPAAVLAVVHFSTSHTAFRRLLNAAGTRYGSMPLFQPFLLREGGPLDLDQAALVGRTRALAARLEGVKRIHVKTPAGTDVTFHLEGRTFVPDDGDLTAPGSFGNLPAGEVYAAPLEDLSEGAVATSGGAIAEVRAGRVVAVTGEGEIRKTFDEHPEWLRVAELGIGTNNRASRVDNVLEAEKILGTVHIAFGDNSSFGGLQQIPYHVDHVQFQPEVTVDGVRLDLNTL